MKRREVKEWEGYESNLLGGEDNGRDDDGIRNERTSSVARTAISRTANSVALRLLRV